MGAKNSSPDTEDLIGTQQDVDPSSERGAYDIEGMNVHAGVSMTWLADHFKMDPGTIKKRLASCPPKGKRRNYLVYDLREAAQFLVIPKIDVMEVIRCMKPSDFPASLQKDYWDAMMKRLKWEEMAGQLWRTEDVLRTFGEAFKHIKTSVTLWVENLERTQGITPAQRDALTLMGDGLLNELYNTLVQTAKTPTTQNVKDEMVDKHDPSERLATVEVTPNDLI